MKATAVPQAILMVAILIVFIAIENYQAAAFTSSLNRPRDVFASSRSKGGLHLRMSTNISNEQSAPQAAVRSTWGRPCTEATDIIEQVLYPEEEYRQRMDAGRDAQFGDGNKYESIASSEGALSVDDPRLSLTYHEFPLQSMDDLLQLAIEEYQLKHGKIPEVIVDLGSGCGRLVLYAALNSYGCKDGNEEGVRHKWSQVHGIEISSELHDYALEIVSRGFDEGYFASTSASASKSNSASSTTVHFHHGPASEFKHILAKADIIFCYSTVFDTQEFNVEMKAMILDDKWSLTLANACQRGAVIVTTDRALNPEHGWSLKHVLDVDNPSLFGSTGYVSIIN